MFILLAAVLWSTSGAFVKSIDEMPAVTIAMYRAFFAGAALMAWTVLGRKRITWHPQMVGMVLCFAVMNYLFIGSMTRTTAANTIFLQYTAPLWMLAASVLLLGEPLVRKNLLLVLGAWLGLQC